MLRAFLSHILSTPYSYKNTREVRPFQKEYRGAQGGGPADPSSLPIVGRQVRKREVRENYGGKIPHLSDKSKGPLHSGAWKGNARNEFSKKYRTKKISLTPEIQEKPPRPKKVWARRRRASIS